MRNVGRRMGCVVVTCVSLAACSSPPPDPIDGAWHVQTGLLPSNIASSASYMEGTLIVSPKEDGTKQCALSMTQHSYVPLAGFKIGDYSTTAVQETCQVIVSGNAVSIVSSVPEGSNWVPDNFELVLEGDRMTGKLISATSAKAVFRRKTADFIASPAPEGFSGRETIKDQPTGWQSLGKGSDGCRYEYQSPIDLYSTPASIRLTIRSSCGGQTDKGNVFENMEFRAWYECAANTQYVESEIYFQNGEVVERWTPSYFGIKVDGPGMREAGIGGTVLQSNSLFGQLYGRFCA